jgi:hypothetical protein
MTIFSQPEDVKPAKGRDIRRIGLSKAISDPYKMYRRIKNERISPRSGWIFNGIS